MTPSTITVPGELRNAAQLRAIIAMAQLQGGPSDAGLSSLMCPVCGRSILRWIRLRGLLVDAASYLYVYLNCRRCAYVGLNWYRTVESGRHWMTTNAYVEPRYPNVRGQL